ncbi:C40 family peptidase [Nocardioides sp.]|uniref:C40 family peptidase n=1 Tax=Nocardioides sp. TaxID=35761 RepID=UPI00261942BE|nr:C40 family peptidase [Nocardioides sp.]
MSVTSVMDRIQAIEAQIEQLSSLTSSDSSSTFSTELNSALGTTSTTGTSTTLGRATTSSEVSAAQQQVISAAESALGVPYVWGGNSLSTGVDCSGLVQQAYKAIGIDLPRLSADQAKSGTAVSSLADAQPGDLLAWDNSSRNNGADHIAIYLGNGKMIEAPRTGLDVRIVDVPSTPDYIRRVIGTTGTSTTTGSTATSTRTTTGDATAAAVRAAIGSESVATSRSAYDLQALFAGLS